MKKNSKELRRLMKARGITRDRAGKELQVSRKTIDAWLAPDDAGWGNEMPARSLVLARILWGANGRK